MGEINHAHNAEDQRQSGSEQEQGEAELQPVEKLLDKKLHGLKPGRP